MRRNYQFQDSARICVVGVGGGGSNAVNRMISDGLKGIKFITVNADIQCLTESQAPTRIQIGQRITHGLGTGGDPHEGERAAYEVTDEIRAALTGADMVFITTGMGGGTGSGASPVIAKIAQELGILTIAIVTRPFSFEGPRHTQIADEGIRKLRSYVNSLIVIPNDRLIELCDEQTNLSEAFRMADNVLKEGVQAISDLVNKPGLINLDFADVRAVMSQEGGTLATIGRAQGKNRARIAVERAIHSPLLGLTIDGAQAMLVNITAGPDLHLLEIEQIARLLRTTVRPNANFILGTVLDEGMGDEIRVTVIATGFEQSDMRSRPAQKRQDVRARLALEPALNLAERQPAAVQFSLKNYMVPAFLQSA